MCITVAVGPPQCRRQCKLAEVITMSGAGVAQCSPAHHSVQNYSAGTSLYQPIFFMPLHRYTY